jgi:hypothetical protein
MNETISRTHWFQYLLQPVIIILSLGIFIFTLKINIEKSSVEQMPIGSWILVGLIASVGISSLICLICFYKKLVVTENTLKIKYPLIGKEIQYNNSDVLSYFQHLNSGKYRDYKTFHFKTSDGNIFMFSDYEFQNYKKLVSLISLKSKKEYIAVTHNLKQLLIIFFISSLLTLIIILLTIKLGIK